MPSTKITLTELAQKQPCRSNEKIVTTPPCLVLITFSRKCAVGYVCGAKSVLVFSCAYELCAVPVVAG